MIHVSINETINDFVDKALFVNSIVKNNSDLIKPGIKISGNVYKFNAACLNTTAV